MPHVPQGIRNRRKASRTPAKHSPIPRFRWRGGWLALWLVPFVGAGWLSASELESASAEPRGDRQDSRLARLLERHRFRARDVGYYVFRLDDGRTVAAHDPDTPRIPASTTKLLTGLAAWKILGPDYRFETKLLTTGEVRINALHGDVHLVGGGDPSLSTPDLRSFVEALRAAGIRRVRGRFVFDESLIPAVSAINPRQPAAAVYNPGFGALALNYNRVRLRWTGRPGTSGFRSRLHSPADGVLLPVSGAEVAVLPADAGQTDSFVLDDGSGDRWLLSRTLPARGVRQLPVKRAPGRLAATLFRTYSRQLGIDLPAPEAGVPPANATPLAVHPSRSLTDLLEGMFRYSNNLSAELIGVAASRGLGSGQSSLAASARSLAAWYARRIPQTDWTGFVNHNHSGLSSRSRHTPRQLAGAVAYAASLNTDSARTPADEEQVGLLDLLSHPEWKSAAVRERVRAKSGTMRYADGLAGWLTAESGTQLGFAVLLTDFAAREAFDASRAARTTTPTAGAQAWTRRAKAFQQALITGWIRDY